MEFISENSNSRIISISILHRHGSRGPGDSELGPWKSNPECPVRAQWSKDELERLNTPGHRQCEVLGKWFNRYVSSHSVGKSGQSVFFRSSTSGRGKESGQDFIRGFNTERAHQANTTPTPYDYGEKADNYFRPWKILPEFSETLKERCANDKLWADKAAENKEFLQSIFTRVGAGSVLSKLTKTLWASTYLHCIKECELFWPLSEGRNRRILTNMLSEAEWERVSHLACWVWEERFVRSGFTVSMGGKLVNEILTRALDPQIDVSIYSAHDYTILAVLALLGLIPYIDSPANFACYVLFELWDGPPPPHASGPPRKAAVGCTHDEPHVLRVIFNSTPFHHDTPLEQLEVQVHNERVFGEFSLSELRELTALAKSEFHLFQVPVVDENMATEESGSMSFLSIDPSYDEDHELVFTPTSTCSSTGIGRNFSTSQSDKAVDPVECLEQSSDVDELPTMGGSLSGGNL